jgi:hypothetical protein
MAALVGVVDDAAQPTVPLGTGVGTEARGEFWTPAERALRAVVTFDGAGLRLVQLTLFPIP